MLSLASLTNTPGDTNISLSDRGLAIADNGFYQVTFGYAAGASVAGSDRVELVIDGAVPVPVFNALSGIAINNFICITVIIQLTAGTGTGPGGAHLLQLRGITSSGGFTITVPTLGTSPTAFLTILKLRDI